MKQELWLRKTLLATARNAGQTPAACITNNQKPASENIEKGVARLFAHCALCKCAAGTQQQ
ncbi:hypothetical protein [Pseudomonas putida]|uniref:hypothetical protein n=1 Tax=Pseudomonas putida TaxID=303 RepID=UPI002022EBB9|nr:hypothetical protein [Pseudomonas putida]MCL8307662.1 hypothetical protein [Pseudomonas putida]